MNRLLLILLLIISKVGFSQQETIYFDYNSYELSSQAQTTLTLLSKLEIDSIRLVGHCDSRGDNQLNIDLSKNRAEAGKAFILNLNPNIIISTDWKSFSEPKTSNNTEKGMSQNRRVEIYYSLKKTSPKEEIKKTSKELAPITPAKLITKHKCQVTNQKGEFISKGEFFVFDENNKPVSKSIFEKGRFNILDSGQVNQIRIDGNGYFSQMVNLKRISEYCVIHLQEIKKNNYFTFQNLGFVPNDSILLDSSYPELEGLLKTLNENPKLAILIEGHTNGVNTTQSPEWHELISTGRAHAVYSYLTENGIDKNRLSYDGFGCKKMIYPHAINNMEAQANRRVEIKVVAF